MEKSDSSARLKRSENLDQKSSRPAASSNGGSSRLESGKEEETSVDADDAWEAMVVASPQMHEINERAEEFIARFRAQMRQQEILARRL